MLLLLLLVVGGGGGGGGAEELSQPALTKHAIDVITGMHL